MRGKKPLSENHVKSLRKLVDGNEFHELLLILGSQFDVERFGFIEPQSVRCSE